jgi:hypothetical protein
VKKRLKLLNYEFFKVKYDYNYGIEIIYMARFSHGLWHTILGSITAGFFELIPKLTLAYNQLLEVEKNNLMAGLWLIKDYLLPELCVYIALL